jgi:hemerythrin-like domain-containing protein
MDEQHEYIKEVAQGVAELTGRGSGGLDGRQVEELIRLSKELFNVIQHHIVDEENQLLRLADLHLSALEQDNLAATMRDLEVG